MKPLEANQNLGMTLIDNSPFTSRIYFEVRKARLSFLETYGTQSNALFETVLSPFATKNISENAVCKFPYCFFLLHDNLGGRISRKAPGYVIYLFFPKSFIFRHL